MSPATLTSAESRCSRVRHMSRKPRREVYLMVSLVSGRQWLVKTSCPRIRATALSIAEIDDITVRCPHSGEALFAVEYLTK